MADDSLTPNPPESVRSATTAPAPDASLECPVCGTRLRHDLGRNALIRDDAPTPGAVEDERFYCPVCYYNLTGQPSGRCPECGSLFDREQLLQAQVTGEVALMPWDDPSVPSGWPSFWQTTRITCGQPKRFSMAVSVLPQHTGAGSYYAVCLAIMVASLGAPVLGVALGGARANDLRIVCLGLSVPFVATLIGNLVWSGLYTILFIHPDGRRRLGPWRTIVHYASGHLLLYAPMMLIFVVLTPVFTAWLGEPIFLMFAVQIGSMGVFVLWCLTMAALLTSRAPKSLTPMFAMGVTLILGAIIYFGTWWVLGNLA